MFAKIIVGFISVMIVCLLMFMGIDTEVARRDYVKNVETCTPIEGCLFESTCRKYNKMIELECL